MQHDGWKVFVTPEYVGPQGSRATVGRGSVFPLEWENMFDLCEHRSSWNVVYQESSHARAAASLLCAFWNLKRASVVGCTSDAPCLHRVVAAILHLRCQAPTKWVMGSVRSWCARWGCERPLLGRWEAGAPWPPPELFLRLPRRRRGSTKWAKVARTPDTSPVAFDGTFIASDN